MKSAAQIRNLRALIDRADAVAKSAKGEIARAVKDIQKELLYLLGELDVGARADAREQVFKAIGLKMSRLNRRLNNLVSMQMQVAGKVAHKDATREWKAHTGQQPTVQFSEKHQREMLELLENRGGGNMAATLTGNMTKHAVDVLRSAVVSAFHENAVAGGSLHDLTKIIRDKWEAAARDTDTFGFVDKAGRVWNVDNYLMMNVRTNTMAMYNESIIDTYVRQGHTDLVMVSDDGRTKDSCEACQRWAGRILSVSGQDKRFPTLDEARADGLFHPNCIHTLQPVDEDMDEDLIEEQAKEVAEE